MDKRQNVHLSLESLFLVQMWQSGIDASRRIDELKSGVPIGETIVIKGGEEAWSSSNQSVGVRQKRHCYNHFISKHQPLSRRRPVNQLF